MIEPLPIASKVRRWRVPEGGSAPPRSRPPLGVATLSSLGSGSLEEGDAVWVSPPDEPAGEVLAALLPDPQGQPGMLVVVGEPAPPQGLARIFGRRPARLARAVRGAALLLRGYGDIGGGVDPTSGLDLTWGTAP